MTEDQIQSIKDVENFLTELVFEPQKFTNQAISQMANELLFHFKAEEISRDRP